jgi:hypothetical protein
MKEPITFISLVILLSISLYADNKKNTHQDVSSDQIVEYGSVEEKKEKRGTILRWRYTRPPGKKANKGEWKPSQEEAEKDLWDNGTTKTPTTDGFSSSGSVVGVVFKEANPPTVTGETDACIIQKDKPDRKSKGNSFRWVCSKLSVVVVNYAEEHGPTYQYFSEDEKPLDKAPPNVPQNEP